jgi:REP element-mobilizing transposase RayT
VSRRGRREAPGAVHHVVAQGNNRQAIVLDDSDRVVLLQGVADGACRFSWCLHAYCLMTTHLHVVVETRDPNLGQGMGRLLGGYARWFNRRHGREGHLFMKPFFSRLLETDEQVLAATLYVLVNPVRARLCRHPSEWLWGSYADAVERHPTLVPTTPLLGRLAPDPRDARARLRSLVDAQVARIEREQSGAAADLAGR